MNSGVLEPARQCLEAALREEPGDVMTGHLLAALRGDNPEQAADGYVRQLFDAGAATFDFELVSKLPRERAMTTVEGCEILGCGLLPDLGFGRTEARTVAIVAADILQLIDQEHRRRCQHGGHCGHWSTRAARCPRLSRSSRDRRPGTHDGADTRCHRKNQNPTRGNQPELRRREGWRWCQVVSNCAHDECASP
jgi:hypothetical protein